MQQQRPASHPRYGDAHRRGGLDPLGDALRHDGDHIVRKEPYGALIYNRTPPATIKMDRREAEQLLNLAAPYPDDLAAPEVCHLSLTEACNRQCPYCYLDRSAVGQALSQPQICRILDDLAEAGVLQVTFGGGEPCIRDDVLELAEYAAARGLNISMTTNGDFLHKLPIHRFAVFSQVNISIHSVCDNEAAVRDIEDRIALLQTATTVGLNVVAQPWLLEQIGLIGSLAVRHGVTVTLLEAKQGHGASVRPLGREHIAAIRQGLLDAGASVRLECSLVGRCPAGVRFANIRSNGDVTPCVFVSKTYGNLQNESFHTVWKAMRHLRPLAAVHSLEGTRPQGDLLCALK